MKPPSSDRKTGDEGADPSAATSRPPERLLIVDDDPGVREVLYRWLIDEGYPCECAGSAEEALELLRPGAFALVVADIGLPGKSGVELLREVRDRLPDTAVMMVTALTDRLTAIRALELGAYGYLIKPFERNEVVINVVNALERRRLVLQSEAYGRRLEEKVRQQTSDLRVSHEEISLRLIAAQEYRHDETGAHIRRIGLYAEAVGRRMGYPRELTEMLRLAAPMHDVGKIGIPDSILLKKGKLDPGEWEIMKTHTTIGARILKGSAIELLNLSREIALCHHEKWDGSGYPNGLAGDDIPEAAHVVAILDVYDALVHERVYRPAFPEEKALGIMREGSGTQFRPALLDLFLEMLPELRRIRQQIKDRASQVRKTERPAGRPSEMPAGNLGIAKT